MRLSQFRITAHLLDAEVLDFAHGFYDAALLEIGADKGALARILPQMRLLLEDEIHDRESLVSILARASARIILYQVRVTIHLLRFAWPCLACLHHSVFALSVLRLL